MKVVRNSIRERAINRSYKAKYNRSRILPLPKGNYTVIDSGTDQAYIGDGYKVVHIHEQELLDHEGISRKVVDAVAVFTDRLSNGKAKSIIRINRGLWVPGSHETLVPPDQISWKGDLDVDVRPIAFGGRQNIIGPHFTMDLLWDGKLVYFPHIEADAEKHKKLPVWTLTSRSRYDPQSLAIEKLGLDILHDMEVSDSDSDGEAPTANLLATPKVGLTEPMDEFHAAKRRRLPIWEPNEYIWKPHQINEWKKRLTCGEEAVKKTFMATTQLVPSLKHENQTIIKDYHVPRFPMLSCRRIDDTFFCDIVEWTEDNKPQKGMLFAGERSKYWAFYPMGKEASSAKALDIWMEFVRDVGAPRKIVSDYASNLSQSEKWKRWTKMTLVKVSSTEAHKHNQNYVEQCWQDLKYRAHTIKKTYMVPDSKQAAMFRHLCDCNNHTAHKSLKWRTPMEEIDGETPDISVFRYSFWEPVWYLEGPAQFPERNWIKGRFLGVAWNVGDQMCYAVCPEPKGGTPPKKGKHMHGRTVCRSLVVPRHPDENGPREILQNKSDYYFPTPKLSTTDVSSEGRKKRKSSDISTNEPPVEESEDEAENTPAVETVDEEDANNHRAYVPPGPMEEKLREEFLKLAEDHDKRVGEITATHEYLDSTDIERIVRHFIRKQRGGVALPEAEYTFDVEMLGGEIIKGVSLGDLKVDAPLSLARYIYDKKGLMKVSKLADFAKEVITKSDTLEALRQDLEGKTGISARRKQVLGVTSVQPIRVKMRRTGKHKAGRNKRKSNPMGSYKYGIYVPRNTEEALKVDEANGNTLWAEAIRREIKALWEMGTFELIDKAQLQAKQGSFQYAPLRMIYDVKQDLRRKARLVIGGHVIDSSGTEVYASNMKTISARILMLIATANKLQVRTGDIGNAYLYAKTDLDIYVRLGKEFNVFDENIPVGSLAQVVQALYGLPSSANRWHAHLADTLRGLGYKPTRGDPDVWFRPKGDLYEYIGTHTDDLMVVSSDAEAAMEELSKVYTIKKIGVPEFHLGCDYKYDKKTGKWLMGTKTYVAEALKKVQKILDIDGLGKGRTPMSSTVKPEMDDSAFLTLEEHRQFQQLMGIAQWLITCGRMDITQSTTSLTRFNAAPRRGHLKMAERLFRYLNQFPDKWVVIDPADHKPAGELTDPIKGKAKVWDEKYPDAKEILDKQFPKPRGKAFSTDMYFDSNFAHDEMTRRSITGLVGFVGNTPVVWNSKRQGAVATSTYSAELCAGKMATEEVASLRYLLRSFGVPLKGSTRLIGDNLGSLQTVCDPASTITKKHESVAYHYIRECSAAGMIQCWKIHTDFNKADPFTKALDHNTHWSHFDGMIISPPHDLE
jgi:hypothetical protein